MTSATRNERIAIEGMIDCRNAADEQWRVLRWRRQIDGSAPGGPARWESTGPAVFTLLDASAVIQIGGSALQIVANGMVLHVVDHLDVWQAANADGQGAALNHDSRALGGAEAVVA